MVKTKKEENLLFQSEMHPLVRLEHETEEKYCLSLIHKKAYHCAASIAANLDVLDVGCNNGYGTKVIAENARSVIGVDVGEHSIEAARTLHAAENAEYFTVHGDKLPFPDQSFDLVTSFQVIEHVLDVESYLLEIKRVLKAGGTAIFTTPNRAIRLDPGMRPWNSFHITEYSASQLRELVGSVFPDVEVQGLFATPGFYEIEFNRCNRKRLAARSLIRKVVRAARRARTMLIDAIKFVLPEGAVKLIQSLVRNLEAQSKSNECEHRVDIRRKSAEFSIRILKKIGLRICFADPSPVPLPR